MGQGPEKFPLEWSSWWKKPQQDQQNWCHTYTHTRGDRAAATHTHSPWKQSMWAWSWAPQQKDRRQHKGTITPRAGARQLLIQNSERRKDGVKNGCEWKNSRELGVSSSLASFGGKRCKVETGRSTGDQRERRFSSVWEGKEPRSWCFLKSSGSKGPVTSNFCSKSVRQIADTLSNYWKHSEGPARWLPGQGGCSSSLSIRFQVPEPTW